MSERDTMSTDAVARLEAKLQEINLARGKGKGGYSWKHGWIPLNLKSALVKAKGNRARAAGLIGTANGPKDKGDKRVGSGGIDKPKAPEAPTKAPKGPNHPVSDLDDSELDAEVTRLMEAGDFDNPRMAEIAAEMDFRESQQQRYGDEMAKYDYEQEQIAAGKSPVWRRGGTSNAAKERAMRDEYETHVEIQFLAAEQATNGNLLSKDGRRAGVQPRDLFTRSRRSLKWASEELQRYFAENPRMSYQEFRAGSTNDDVGRAARQRAGSRGWESEFA